MFMLVCQQAARSASHQSPRAVSLLSSQTATHSPAGPRLPQSSTTRTSDTHTSESTAPHHLAAHTPAAHSTRHSNALHRGFAAAAAPPPPPAPPARDPDNDIYILPMPRLSHEMEIGRVVKWLKKEGDEIDMYDLLCEVSTETLVTAEFKEGAFAGTVNLLIESQEYGVLSRVLIREGESVKVGTPIAVVAEGPATPAAVAAAGYRCETTDVYDASQPQVKVLTWQSYLAGPAPPRKGEEEAGPGGPLLAPLRSLALLALDRLPPLRNAIAKRGMEASLPKRSRYPMGVS
ncbi:MAG: hypothetical protein WDW38_006007 [Sanguina aurantia]